MAIGSDWQRVAEYVRDRRIELDLTQADIHSAGGPSPATQRLIEGALQTSYQAAILARLERALQWERGSIRAIRRGGEPVPVVMASAPSDAELDRIERQIGLDLSSLPADLRRALLRHYQALDARMSELERREAERQDRPAV
jgi:hypothetical protein